MGLLLASSSPRRIELLSAARFEFRTISPKIAERFDVDLTLRELTAFNAIRKGASVARANPGEVVLAADTLVALDGRLIGKPSNLNHAREILTTLSGQTHDVCSAVFLCYLAGEKSKSFQEISRVRFRKLSRAQIDEYLLKEDPLDKAGAYAAQGSGAEIIEKIEGSYTNVVGLPMEKTVLALAEFGVRPK